MRSTLRKLKNSLRQLLVRRYLGRSSRESIRDYASVLIVAPHPDDEIIGIGGYLVGRVQAGRKVYIVYLTDGENSLEDLDPEEVAWQRGRLKAGVLARLGLNEAQTRRFQLPDGSVPRSGDERFGNAVSELGKVIAEVRPEALFVTHPLDTWPFDHVAAFEIAEAAVRQSGMNCDLYGYWVWLWYSIPIRRIANIDWQDVYTLPTGSVAMKEKRALMDLYLKPACRDGRPWCGILPDVLLRSVDKPYEVVQLFRKL
jgi:LmbE family N-acetylglucosaminyl deacetylase